MPRVVLEQQFDALGNRTSVEAGIGAHVGRALLPVANSEGRVPLPTLSATGKSARPTSCATTGGNPVADKRVDFDYNALSQFTSIERFADLGGTQLVVDSDYLYDHAARLTDLTHRQGSTVLADYNWTYDAFSRVTSLWSPTDGSVTYSYDDTDQLTGANYSQIPDESFSYDLTGNRTMTGYVTGANNRLLSDGTFNYAYDDEGNRISKTNIATGEVTEYSWDHRNRLVGIVEKDGQGQVTQTVGYSYDCFNRRIAKVITPAVGPSELDQYIYDGEHIALRFENGNLANRYLHGPVIDQILADEQLDVGTGQTDRLLWPLTDNLGSVRDLAEFNDTTGITAIVDHIIYSAFGDILSKTNPSLDHLFGYTGRETDPESDLLFYRARYYDPTTGRFISEDPIGFAAGDVNVARYVGNGPTNATDPSGLAEGWEWNWHHLLDQAVFNEDFIARHGLQIDIHSAEYGWMLRAKDHTWTGGIHPEGWSRDWQRWIGQHERTGTKITKDMIDEQLQKMISKYKLNERGFAAEFCYEQVERAYRVAERMARRRAAQAAAEVAAKAAGKAAGELAENATKTGSKGKAMSKLVKIPVIGVAIGVFFGAALGDDDAVINAIEPIGLGPTVMGDAEIRTDFDQLAYEAWQLYQYELDLRWAEREMLARGLDVLAREAQRFGKCPLPPPVSSPSRSSLTGGR